MEDACANARGVGADAGSVSAGGQAGAQGGRGGAGRALVVGKLPQVVDHLVSGARVGFENSLAHFVLVDGAAKSQYG